MKFNKVLESWGDTLTDSMTPLGVISLISLVTGGLLMKKFGNKVEELHAAVNAGEDAREKLRAMGMYEEDWDHVYKKDVDTHINAVIDALNASIICDEDDTIGNANEWMISDTAINTITKIARYYGIDFKHPIGFMSLEPGNIIILEHHHPDDNSIDRRVKLRFEVVLSRDGIEIPRFVRDYN